MSDQVARASMGLDWKEFNVDLEAFVAYLRGELDSNFAGASAGLNLTLHFLEEPSEEDKELVMDKWEEIDSEEHEMAASYMSREDLEVDRAAKKASAKAKIAAAVPSLTAEELAAILG